MKEENKSAEELTSKQLQEAIEALDPLKNVQDLAALAAEMLAEEGMSSPSEDEVQEEEKATNCPAMVKADETAGNKYMRVVSQKGLGQDKEMMWLVKDMHAELKTWGHPGGKDNKLLLKSDGKHPS